MISDIYEILRTVFTALDIFFFAFFIFIIIKSWKFRVNLGMPIRREERSSAPANAILKERWEAVFARSKTNSPESVRLAIIDADNLINDVLISKHTARQGLGFEDASMAEKLKNLSKDDFKTLDRIWEAHHTRNKLVHEPDFEISSEEAHKVLENYKAFLEETGVI